MAQLPEVKPGQADSSDSPVRVSFATTPYELTLLRIAGGLVGLRVVEVKILLDNSGKRIPIEEGHVGVLYMTKDSDLLDRFDTKVRELKAAQQVAPIQA